jgi:hypothetical protein
LAWPEGFRDREFDPDVEGGFITARRLKGSEKTVQPLIEHPDQLFNEKWAVPVFVRNMQAEQRLFPFQLRQLELSQICDRSWNPNTSGILTF